MATAETHHSSPPTAGRVVLEARDVSKSFRLPHHRVDSLKERLTHPTAHRSYTELRALKSVSFDVREGEFFGIVGRNGSGKSTLLKILASIYRADTGRIRVAGRLAPFIELGVGFNPELTSRENVVLNGVLMGLSRREARRRLDAVLDFAGLEEFVDLQLKNYSSGMLVRLAFAVMVEADADIMLVDEVLAVGDARFAQKCYDVFTAKRRAGKTLILVTHDMSTVQAFCDRAMVLDHGDHVYTGDAEEAAIRYYRLNFASGADATPRPGGIPDVNVRVHDAWLEDAGGRRVDNVEQGRPIRLNAVFEARQTLLEPTFGFHFINTDDAATLFGVHHSMVEQQLEPGDRVTLTGTVENLLLPGRYSVHCWATRNRTQGDFALHALRLFDFVVYGTQAGPGSVIVESVVEAVVER